MKKEISVDKENCDFSSFRFAMMKIISRVLIFFYNYFYKMQIQNSSILSPFAFLDKTYPEGICIGKKTFITRGTVVLTHDFCRSICCTTKIGDNVFIGVNSIIMPGVDIGNNVIIGSGSVVTANIPSNSITIGNPCRVIKSEAGISEYGRLKKVANDKDTASYNRF